MEISITSRLPSSFLLPINLSHWFLAIDRPRELPLCDHRHIARSRVAILVSIPNSLHREAQVQSGTVALLDSAEQRGETGLDSAVPLLCNFLEGKQKLRHKAAIALTRLQFLL